MKNLFYIFFLSLIFIKNIFAFDVYEVFQERLKKINNFHAYFNQKITDNNNNIVKESKGEIWIKNPNKFYLVIFPNIMIIVSDGKNLWIYNEIINQVNLSWLKDNMDINPLNFMINKNYLNNYKLIKKNDDFILSIKNDNINYKKIVINLSNKGILSYIKIKDNNYNSIYFFKKQSNSEIINKKFIFSIPKNAIIDDKRN